MLKNVISAVVLMVALSACGGANLVRKDRVGGRVELTGAYMPAMADARLLMAEHCQGRFAAVERSDEVEFECRAPAAGSDVLAARAR
jgi:hypothetical protein